MKQELNKNIELNDSVLLIMEIVKSEDKEKISFMENYSQLKKEDYLIAIDYLLNRFNMISGIPYNEILDDLKLDEDDKDW